MYIINNFVFGHELAVNEELNNELWGFDLEFRKIINGKEYVVDFPYHGGQCKGDVYSCIFGVNITDDDGNREFSKEIRAAKAEDYLEDYKIFLKDYIVYLRDNIGLEDDYDVFVDKFIKYLESTEPDFYTVESSS